MLYSQSQGQGEHLVLLHGWGFSGDIFQSLIERYQDRYCITTIDLPGHGQSPEIDGGLSEWTEAVIEVLPENPILLGWSLGGLLAIQVATQIPIKSLILMASTPKFVQDDHWAYGIGADNFQQFSEELNQNPTKGIKRFVSLQTKDKSQLKALNRSIDQNPISLGALNQGLAILLETDLTEELRSLKTDKRAVLGTKDTLVPSKISDWYQQQHVQTKVLNTGHMPFLASEFEL